MSVGFRPAAASWSLERIEAPGHELGDALADLLDEPRAKNGLARAVDVGRVEEQVLQLALLEELHQRAAMGHGHERRQRSAAAQNA